MSTLHTGILIVMSMVDDEQSNGTADALLVPSKNPGVTLEQFYQLQVLKIRVE